MKPGKPLKTNKPLKAKKGLTTTKPLQTRKQLFTKKRIKFRSEKMERIYEKRQKLVARILADRPNCEAHCIAGCTGKSVDVHERLARSLGGSIADGPADLYLSVCRPCHIWITDHPLEARQKGLALSPWETTSESSTNPKAQRR